MYTSKRKGCKSKPAGEVEQDLVVGAAPESLALAGAAVNGGERHGFPSRRIIEDLGGCFHLIPRRRSPQIDPAPQGGLVARESPPRDAREPGAGEDLALSQHGEGRPQDVMWETRPATRRRRRRGRGGGHRESSLGIGIARFVDELEGTRTVQNYLYTH